MAPNAFIPAPRRQARRASPAAPFASSGRGRAARRRIRTSTGGRRERRPPPERPRFSRSPATRCPRGATSDSRRSRARRPLPTSQRRGRARVRPRAPQRVGVTTTSTRSAVTSASRGAADTAHPTSITERPSRARSSRTSSEPHPGVRMPRRSGSGGPATWRRPAGCSTTMVPMPEASASPAWARSASDLSGRAPRANARPARLPARSTSSAFAVAASPRATMLAPTPPRAPTTATTPPCRTSGDAPPALRTRRASVTAAASPGEVMGRPATAPAPALSADRYASMSACSARRTIAASGHARAASSAHSAAGAPGPSATSSTSHAGTAPPSTRLRGTAATTSIPAAPSAAAKHAATSAASDATTTQRTAGRLTAPPASIGRQAAASRAPRRR